MFYYVFTAAVSVSCYITHIFPLVCCHAAFYLFFVLCFRQIYYSFSWKCCWGADVYFGFLSTFLHIFIYPNFMFVWLQSGKLFLPGDVRITIDSNFQMVQHLESAPLSYSQMLIGLFSFVVYLLRKKMNTSFHPFCFLLRFTFFFLILCHLLL